MWQRNGMCLVMFINLYPLTYCSTDRMELSGIKEFNTLSPLETLIKSSLFNMMMISRIRNSTDTAKLGKSRVKRQGSGAGKFADAAKIDNLKAFRIYITMFKNLWSQSYVGAPHPFHPEAPKPVIQLFKARVMDFFFPPIGADALKQ